MQRNFTKKLLGCVTLICIFLQYRSLGQEPKTKYENWKDYYSFWNAKKLAKTSDRVYCASNNALCYFDIAEKTIHKISKLNGLSDVGIKTIACNDSDKTLIVGYENGNIDIITEDATTNIVDIKLKQINNNKSINDIKFMAGKAFLATTFGIVVIDYKKAQIEDTYILNSTGEYVNVSMIGTDVDHKTLYVATSNGVYKGIYGLKNLADFSNWEKIDAFGSVNYNAIAYFYGTVYANYYNNNINNIKDTLFEYKNGIKKLFKQQYEFVNNLKISNNQLIVADQKSITVFDSTLYIKNKVDTTNYYYAAFRDAEIADESHLWIADANFGMLNTVNFWPTIPAGPLSDFSSSINYNNGYLYVTNGNAWYYYLTKLSRMNIETFDWKGFYNWETNDALQIAFVPGDSLHYYVATWVSGVLEGTSWNGISNIYYTKNSILKDAIATLTVDSDKNLFIASSRTELPFTVYTANKKWYSWTYPSFPSSLLVNYLTIDKNGYKWVVSEHGIFAFDDKKTLLDKSDDDYNFIPLKDSDGEDVAGSAYSMAIDKNDVLWVGTQNGLAFYPSASSVFGDSNPRMSRSKITINGVVDYILATQDVLCIEVDAANRKWIGTNTGLYLVSSNGTEVLEHYTVDNSPLPSNSINALKIVHEKSLLFIATTKGLVSLNIGVKLPSEDYSHISIYPNPVKHDYTGQITIDGLMDNSIIKIMDVNGNLVYETQSQGGIAFWSGLNVRGKRVASGVYFVVCTSSDNEQKTVAKLVFIN